MGFDVRYELEPLSRAVKVQATVSVRPGRGLVGQVLASATTALLSAGALNAAVSRIAREAVA